MSKNNDTTIIGIYKYAGVIVSTQFITKEYETYVRGPGIVEEEGRYVSKYGMNRVAAVQGHNNWVVKMGGKLSDCVSCEWIREMKISFHALLKIFYQYTSPSFPVQVFSDEKTPNLAKIEINNGPYSGSCVYNFSKMEAISITYLWGHLLAETKEETLVRKIKTESAKKEKIGETEKAVELC